MFSLIPMNSRSRRPAPDPVPLPPLPPPSPFYSGLDLGQSQDHTALAVVERATVPDPERAGQTAYRFDVRHLHRWPLGTSYPSIVADVRALYAGAPLGGSTLVIDETGVGKAVVDMFRAAGIGATLRPYSITSGAALTGDTVAKKHLIAGVQAPLCSGRLRFAQGLGLTPALAQELETYRVRVTADRNETFASWRERDHDDLVLALALALLLASRQPYRVGGLT